MENSFGVRAFSKLAQKALLFLRPLKKTYKSYLNLSLRRTYHTWAVHNEQDCFVTGALKTDALISIVVAAYNTDPTHLMAMVYSVCNQHYEHWELIIVNGSDEPKAKQAIEACQTIDTRIKVIDAGGNLGIAKNTNLGIEAAIGGYTAFLDHDDLLHPCALHACAELIEKQKAELVYSDEDKITHDSVYYFGPHCKPDWSPHLLENLNYINHLTFIKTEFIRKVGGLRATHDGAQDYDLLWRIIDTCKPHIYHVAHVLYHWRAAKTSTAQDISTKSYIFEAGRAAVQAHLGRTHTKAKAEIMENKPGFYQLSYDVPSGFDLVIGYVEPMKRPACAKWVKQLVKEQQHVHLIIGEWFERFAEKTGTFSMSLIPESDYLSHAAKACQNQAVVYLQQAVKPANAHALVNLAAAGLHSGAFAVQPIITGSDKTILDAGLVDATQGLQPLFLGLKLAENTFFGDTDWVRDISTLSGNAFALPKSHFETVIEHAAHPQHLTPLDIPTRKNYVLWAHTVFEYESYLLSNEPSLPTFNPQLTQATFEIRMNSSTWGTEKDREHG